jgi:hypothetical protein
VLFQCTDHDLGRVEFNLDAVAPFDVVEIVQLALWSLFMNLGWLRPVAVVEKENILKDPVGSRRLPILPTRPILRCGPDYE